MHNYFYGWYLKCQSKEKALAIIPAFHQSGDQTTCSIQIITREKSYTCDYPSDCFYRKGNRFQIGNNLFQKDGARIWIHTPQLRAVGILRFYSLHPLKYPIMGPFSWVPYMECRHRIWSMVHFVSGTIYVNGEVYLFQKDQGYWEGDAGNSFPKQYVWTQCLFEGGSLMLSVAEIPFGVTEFTGTIAVVYWRGKEYRLATYLGAKVVSIKRESIRLVQGAYELEARLLEKEGQMLSAPVNGKMSRSIQENICCKAWYCFKKKGKVLFEFCTERASFEYEYK